MTDRERSLASMIVGQPSCSLQSIASTQQAQHAALLKLNNTLDMEVGVQAQEHQSTPSQGQPWLASQAAAALAQARATEAVSPITSEEDPIPSERLEKWSETMEIPKTPPP